MKKTAIYSILCAFALSFTSCQFVKDKINGFIGESEDSTEEIEVVYEDEPYETNDVIDPNDDAAYEKYGGKHEND